MIAHVPLIALAVIALRSDIRLAALGGLLFGIASLLSALLLPTSPLYAVFLNPLISVVPRIIVGVVIYLVYQGVFKGFIKLKKIEGINHPNQIYSLQDEDKAKVKKIDFTSMVVASVAGAITNTILVVGLIFIFYSGQTFALEEAEIIVKPGVLLPLIAFGALTEPISTAIIAPPIVMALRQTSK